MGIGHESDEEPGEVAGELKMTKRQLRRWEMMERRERSQRLEENAEHAELATSHWSSGSAKVDR